MVARSLFLASVAGAALLCAPAAVAADTTSGHDVAVPLSITLNGVRAGDTPLYISVQTEADYRSMEGHGTIVATTEAGTLTRSVELPAAGSYAVSVWHDLDNDGRFSMSDTYEIEDGWATSGVVPRGSAPTFSNAKVVVPGYGADIEIAMIYPEEGS